MPGLSLDLLQVHQEISQTYLIISKQLVLCPLVDVVIVVLFKIFLPCPFGTIVLTKAVYRNKVINIHKRILKPIKL